MKLILNNKLIIIVFIFIVFNNSLYSQKDNLSLKFIDETNEFTSLYNLFISPNTSYWKQLSKPVVNDKKMNPNVNYLENKENEYFKKEVYKDLSSSFIYSNYKIFKHFYFVKDKIEDLNWIVTDSTETILGYNCQIAKTKFRGRTYFASFTEKIPISNGPWKFQGLPGIILKVKSLDDEFGNSYKMECIEIIFTKKNIIPTSKNFVDKNKNKFITWGNFVNDVDKYMKKMIKSVKSSEENEEGGYSLIINQKTYKEVFHMELQTSGIKIEM